MAMASLPMSIGMFIFSIGVGFFAYYIMNDEPKATKKKYMNEVLGQIINIVIYIWIAKVILNFSIVITDPLAILSYPSDANAFYIAILCSAITIVTLLKRRKLSMALFMHAFIHIFLIASFVYELIHIVWNDYTYQIGYFTLITLLIIALISLSDNVPLYWLNIGMILAWTIGSFGLIMNLPIVMVFGYTMMPGFFIFITMITLFFIMYQNRRDVINDRN